MNIDYCSSEGRYELSERRNVFKLVLHKAELKDAGSYKCVAKNEQGLYLYKLWCFKESI